LNASRDKSNLFFSLKWKAISLILAVLLTLCGFLVFLNSYQMSSLASQQQQSNFHDLQNELSGLLLQSYRQSLQLIDLIPSLGSGDAENRGDSHSLIDNLNRNWPTLQLNWGIESATLFDEHGKRIWQTDLGNNLSGEMAPAPIWQIDCHTTCRQVINSPVIDDHGNAYHIQLEVSLADLLIDFSLIANTSIGILIPSVDNRGVSVKDLKNWQQTIKLMTNPSQSLPLLQKLQRSVNFSNAVNNIQSIQVDENTYEVSLTSLPNVPDSVHFVIVVDVSKRSQWMESAQNFHIVVAIGGITLSCLLLLSLLWQPISRLHQQAQLLPLLITGEFSTALDRLKKNRTTHWFRDEIDILNETEEEVCRKLTDMRQDINRKADTLHAMAMYDSLTDLANRRAFMEYISEALQNEDIESHPFALLFIDLDNFKRINDSMGHNAGDELLKIVAQRLRSCVRNTDIIARLGGDEFCIIINGLNDESDHEIVADHLLKRLRVPIRLRSTELIISASIGIVTAPKDGRTSEDLLQNADLAMYKAKALGRNKFQRFDRIMTDQAVEQLAMESELRRAIRAQEFVLHYQPQVDLAKGTIIGFEALVRWQHPDRGLLYPDRFIGLLEETGLIVPLGSWIIDESCRQLHEWQLRGAGDIRLAINISPRQLQNCDLANQVEQALRRHELSPDCLELEITESMLMDNIELTSRQLRSLQVLGVTVAIDDFGTGHSSLSYLKSLPLDILKIDRSFIKDLTQEKDDEEIVSAIIAMAHKLNLLVVAEGIETEAHQSILNHHQCDFGQGYLYSKPLTAEQALEFVCMQQTQIETLANVVQDSALLASQK
jgi:diguanylate cyclase (GGDEF)-like protein